MFLATVSGGHRFASEGRQALPVAISVDMYSSVWLVGGALTTASARG